MVKGLTTSFLTGLLGTAGASLSTLLGLDATLWYFVRIEAKELNAFQKERHSRRKLIISLLCMTAILFLYHGVLDIVFGPITHRSAAFFVGVIGVGIGTSVFIYAVIRLRLFTTREWLVSPFGKKILRSNRKIRK